MGMREECKHFQSRTYKSGRGRAVLRARQRARPAVVVSRELPHLRAAIRRRRLVPRLPRGPAGRVAPPDVPIEDRRELLDSASEIVNAVAPDLIEERRREIEEQRRRERRAWKFWRR